MMNPSEFCQDDTRRDAVRAKPGLNGLDYLDVSGDQLTLKVFFLGKAPAQLLKQTAEGVEPYKARLKQSVRIEGGRRIRDIGVEKVTINQAKDLKTGKVDPRLDDSMDVQVDKYGDFSTYTLRLVDVKEVDPFYDHLDFTFKVDCASDLDCLPDNACPPTVLSEPEINYLAKDYATFRRLILDRLALTMPDWQERHVPDIGVTLVEVLAYVGDYLSYYQDAVATEAYLDTARRRISVRRHARLVDYRMHEGCNARAWVCLETEADQTLDPKNIFFITGLNGVLPASGPVLKAEDLNGVSASRYEVFEPILQQSIKQQSIKLYEAHNAIHFYTWGNRECCLPKGATRATLRYDWRPAAQAAASVETGSKSTTQKLASKGQTPEQTAEPAPDLNQRLQPGDVLIFEEVNGPKTGDPADADPTHRHAVRLIRVDYGSDELPAPPVDLVEIEWGQEDALPFPLCLSAITDAGHGCEYQEDISVARGNVVWVDHGRTEAPEDLGVVPCQATQATCECADHPAEMTFVPGSYRPKLERTPLTFRQRLPKDGLPKNSIVSAVRRMAQDDLRTTLPQISLKNIPAAPVTDCAHARPLFRLDDWRDPTSLVSTLRDKASLIARILRTQLPEETVTLIDAYDGSSDALLSKLKDGLNNVLCAWTAEDDLLSSQSDDSHFVAEVDDDGKAQLRFGNGELGRSPEAGSSFFAEYRVGNGVAGNVSAQAISSLVLRNGTIGGHVMGVCNPLPAQGGADPEPMAEVKLFAPTAFRKELQRAITADDYAQLVAREFKKKKIVQGAAAALNWTGSWYEAQVTIDPLESEEASPPLRKEIGQYLEHFRRVGHDLAVMPAHYVPLAIELTVCVLPHFLRGHVEAELRAVFGARVLPQGKLGFFHPDNLTFGEGIRLSQLVAAAQAVKGVESVRVTQLERLYEGKNGELEQGILKLGAMEVARLDNDPSFPEHGKLTLKMGGGR
jgi:hypothetical protein